MNRLLCALSAYVVIAATVPTDGACPSYMHKDDITVGNPSDLPDGWMAYSVGGKKGLYKSSLQSFSPAVVSGTENDSMICNIDISDDGTWIEYVCDTIGTMVLVRAQGGSRTVVQIAYPHQPRLTTAIAGFVRNSPVATTELFFDDFDYMGSSRGGTLSIIGGITVDLSGSVPSFGSVRTIASFADTVMMLPWGGTFSASVWKDQLFGSFQETLRSGNTIRMGFVTIPNGGAGTASGSNLFKWYNDAVCPYESDGDYWGCGGTMSWDGQYCLANSGWVGSDCVPNKKSDPAMDHKGFYITKFLRQGVDPPIAIDSQIDSPTYGRSANWCPAKYRIGSEAEVDFNEWYFSNNDDYVIGSLTGSLASTLGLWVVNWKTDTWTLVTPDNTSTVYGGPAMYITGGSPVRSDMHSSQQGAPYRATEVFTGVDKIAVPRSCCAVTLYSITGKTLWHSPARPGTTLAIPESLRKNAALIVHFE